MPRSGAKLALLLLAGFRALVEHAQCELAVRGYPHVRPVHEFAMRAIASGADTAAELARRLQVSRQAAAKTVAILESRGYVATADDPHDGRRKRLIVTDRGLDLLREGEAVITEMRDRWAAEIGTPLLEEMEDRLTELVGEPLLDDAPGWLAGGGSRPDRRSSEEPPDRRTD
jgi:DNA-binding MarR family transcriptional regulator